MRRGSSPGQGFAAELTAPAVALEHSLAIDRLPGHAVLPGPVTMASVVLASLPPPASGSGSARLRCWCLLAGFLAGFPACGAAPHPPAVRDDPCEVLAAVGASQNHRVTFQPEAALPDPPAPGGARRAGALVPHERLPAVAIQHGDSGCGPVRPVGDCAALAGAVELVTAGGVVAGLADGADARFPDPGRFLGLDAGEPGRVVLEVLPLGPPSAWGRAVPFRPPARRMERLAAWRPLADPLSRLRSLHNPPACAMHPRGFAVLGADRQWLAAMLAVRGRRSASSVNAGPAPPLPALPGLHS